MDGCTLKVCSSCVLTLPPLWFPHLFHLCHSCLTVHVLPLFVPVYCVFFPVCHLLSVSQDFSLIFLPGFQVHILIFSTLCLMSWVSKILNWTELCLHIGIHAQWLHISFLCTLLKCKVCFLKILNLKCSESQNRTGINQQASLLASGVLEILGVSSSQTGYMLSS